uniref:Elongin-C n=1 Tax=Homo sapiens TaxID=9606 RepID=O75863_HUMAN|nr:fos39347_1 [Homo sapiens]
MNGEEKSCSGYGGPDAMDGKLVSSDDDDFIVKREHTRASGIRKAVLSGPGQSAENETDQVNFREIPPRCYPKHAKACIYFTYKVHYSNSSTEIPEFLTALEVLMASDFLDIYIFLFFLFF